MADILSSRLSLGDVEEIAALYVMNWYLETKRPAFFGYCFDILLYGFLTVQVYLYHLAFPNNGILTKMAVYLVYIIGSIQTIFALRDFYELFCFPGRLVQAKPILLSDLHAFGFMWLTIPVSSALVAVTVQLFYAQRIWIVSHSKGIALTVAFLALAQLGCGIFSAIVTYASMQPPPHGGLESRKSGVNALLELFAIL
ncbi:hypothetical protein D9756_000956 [Leucocoprinus leucothites]|uniref:Transmembrane protein n=1 Tax=Leucocoprinus leucothites TaxID=201217 RepID=A0A8H5LNC7_9AGAR|nr:hypothetical protein D9756_000956 [Leucoagaricus leucothites]